MNINAVSDIEKNVTQGTYAKASKGETAAVIGKSLTDAVVYKNGESSPIFATGEYVAEADNKPASLEDIRNEAEVLKDNLKAICNKMDVGEVVAMDEDGVDINDAEVDEIVTVSEQIRIKLAAAGVEGIYTGDISDADIKAVMGELAVSEKAMKAFDKLSYPATEENIAEASKAYETYESLSKLETKDKLYLLKAGLEPTIDNIYQAQHSSAGIASFMQHSEISDEDFKKLTGQLTGMLEKANIEVNEDNLREIKTFISSGVNINSENLALYARINDAGEILSKKVEVTGDKTNTREAETYEIIDKIAASMATGSLAGQTPVSASEDVLSKSISNAKIAENITVQGAKKFLEDSSYERNLSGLSKALEDTQNGNYSEINVNADATPVTTSEAFDDFYVPKDIQDIKGYRQLQEVRLMLTVQSCVTLEKSGIDVKYEGLTKLVDALKKLEADNIVKFAGESSLNREIGKNAAADTGIKAVDAYIAFRRLTVAPCDAIGSVKDLEVVNISILTEESERISRSYREAGLRYEEMSTEIRPDLGDRLDKAVEASTESILKSLDLDSTNENARAVRILAYNSLEINIESFTRVKEIDTSINSLFDNMTPQIAFKLIKSGADIMNMDIRELNQRVIEEAGENRGSLGKYSSFIYDLRRDKEVSDSDKEKMMGLYTLLKKVSNDGNNAAGALVNQKLSFNLKNLVTAYMTRKSAGFDMTADTVAEADVDRIASKVKYYSELLETTEDIKESAVKLVTENELPKTLGNLNGAKALSKDPAGAFKGYKKGFDREGKRLEAFFDKLDSKKDLISEYESLNSAVSSAVKEVLEGQFAQGQDGNGLDINELRFLGNQVNLMAQLSERNTFYIPYDAQENMTAIRLSVVEGTESVGSFLVDMVSVSLGHINISASVEDDSISGYVHSEKTSEDEFKESIKNGLEAIGFQKINISYSSGSVSQASLHAGVGEAETRRLFAAAKVFIGCCR